MTNQTKPTGQEGNRMIAEFMGFEFKSGITASGSWQRFFKAGGEFKDSFPYALYDTSWDWLMPSWKKCFDKLEEMNTHLGANIIGEMKHYLVSNDIENAYITVIKAIKFINE